ncbi:MAG TPA: response regulator [Desulfuromonadales bacterium]|nr:response regulator [Desulfuromonadales bacterium]
MILLVEDEQLVLNLTERISENLGYQVRSVPNSAEALALAEQHGQEIRLLLTDVVMPEMNGRELAERLQAANSQLKCLYLSGYTANAIAHHGVRDKGLQFIQKPFYRHGLGEKTQEVLRGGNEKSM